MFEVIGMVVVGAVALALLALLVILLVDLVGYQKGALNFRDYVYAGEDKSRWFWVKYGVFRWLRSFRQGSGWYSEVADPESDAHYLVVYENGKIVRKEERVYG